MVFLFAYLSVFDWNLIWIIEYTDIKFSLIGAAFMSGSAFFVVGAGGGVVEGAQAARASAGGMEYVVVRDGDRYVGFTQARENTPGLADTSMTGVLREYRHRGIALAAKARCARCLRERGYARMQTMNHAGNAAMLAVNNKLGYVPVSELIFFNKPIVALP